MHRRACWFPCVPRLVPAPVQYYAPRPSCSLNIFFITSILLLFLAYAFISISPLRNESAGLFTSAVVFAYTSAPTGRRPRAAARPCRATALAAGAAGPDVQASAGRANKCDESTQRPTPLLCLQPTTCGAP